MDQEQSNNQAMGRSLAVYLERNQSIIWPSRPAVVSVVGVLDVGLYAVDAKVKDQEERTFEMAEAGAAFAAASPGHEALFAELDFTRSAIGQLPDAELVHACPGGERLRPPSRTSS